MAYTCGCYTLLDFPSLVTLMHKNIPTTIALLSLVSALIKVIVNYHPEVLDTRYNIFPSKTSWALFNKAIIIKKLSVINLIRCDDL